MIAQDVLDVVFGLPPAEQVELFGQLRERLASAGLVGPTDGPRLTDDALRRVLDERIDEYERDPDGGESWEAVEAELLANLDRK